MHECNTEKCFIDSLSIAMGLKVLSYKSAMMPKYHDLKVLHIIIQDYDIKMS